MTQAKQALGLLGLIVALAGIALNNRLLIWVAIGLLGASIVARMMTHRTFHDAGFRFGNTASKSELCTTVKDP